MASAKEAKAKISPRAYRWLIIATGCPFPAEVRPHVGAALAAGLSARMVAGSNPPASVRADQTC
jgi:hypothetical protein